MRRKHFFVSIVVYFFLFILLIFWLFPFFIALLNSLKTNGELLTNVLSLPKELQFDNYVQTFEKMSYVRSLVNTFVVAIIGVTLMILFSAMAGWRLARTKTKLSKFIFGLFVFSMLVPFSSIMIPLYKTTLVLNVNNSLIGLALVYVGLGVSMAIFLYHGFVKSIPIEIEESALMDGCNSFQTFVYIVIPLLKPITVTIAITNVLWIWNDFLLPLIVLSDNNKYTLLLSTNTLFGQYKSDWTAILSALILAAIPVIVFYVLFQKSILKGIADGAMKG
jgi:raffinose/stachyose/melibiose transport system permease protein